MTAVSVIVVGSYNHDTSFFVAQFPKAGETIHALGSAFSHGGKGSNQAVQAARLGADVALVACLGNDANGDGAIKLWKDEGVDVAFAGRDAETRTGTATILIDEKGENLIVVERGANAKLSTHDIDAASATIASAKVVVTQLETPPDVACAAFRQAQQGKALTILNAAPAPKSIDSVLLALTDILVVNESEACALAGGQPSPLEAARELVALVGKGVVLTLGSKGAVLLRRGQNEIAVPAPSIVPRDTTGAGDAFVGALAAMLAADWPIQEALELAVEAGAFACVSHGAVSSFGTYAQIFGGE